VERKVKVDSYSRVTITAQEAFDALYTGKLKSLAGVHIDGNIETYNSAQKQNADPIPVLEPMLDLANISVEEFDEINQNNWFMPEEMFEFPIVDFLHGKCTTDEQRARVDQELTLFVNHGMLDLLYYLKYLVDTMRGNNILWGVGRGSSVASYILYLLGVHKIDSIKYELDIHEFLKEK
jgi:DNA polymerase III alpha subunit